MDKGLGMAMGRDGDKGWGLHPCPAGFVLPHPHPALHDEENFFTPSLPFRAPPQPVKLHFLLIFPTISTIFLMKPISLMQNTLEITIKFIPSNQINFLEKIE